MMEVFDVIIIGGGPAGVAAGVYTARKRMRSILITESFGGQSIISDDIQNWIGEAHISGLDLTKKFEAHVRSFPDILEIKSPEKVISVKSIAYNEAAFGGRMCDFEVKTEKGTYQGKTVILASGARPRKLGVPGEDKFEGKGVVYCSTCDSPIFAGKKVAVIGGGNSGFEAIQDLFPYASEITLLEYSDALKGDQKTLEEIAKNPKLKETILDVQILEILGETLVTGIKYQDRISGQEKILEIEGVFVEIGSVPNSEMVKNLLQLDPHGQVMINFKHAAASHPGIFAAGDVTDDPYKQNNIAAGDGVRAALAAYNYLLNREKKSPAEETYYVE